MNERGCWTDRQEIETHLFDKSLCDAIIEGIDKNLTCVDIGCGNGSYTMALRDAGINCIGYDGNPLTEELTNGICKVMDFSEPQQIGKFDIVLSLEVGEHIPAQYESRFLNNLRDSSNRIIILSWAIEGQPGTGHVNCRNNDYIIDQMQQRSFNYCKASSLHLRSKSTLPWFSNTIMVFEKWLQYF
jgi:hypothetical protein